jgi:hypothetical protein
MIQIGIGLGGESCSEKQKQTKDGSPKAEDGSWKKKRTAKLKEYPITNTH